MKKLMIYGLIVFGAFRILQADTSTTRIGLTKPSIGSTGWGTKWNTNADTIDSNVAVLASSNTFTQPQTVSSSMTISGQLNLNNNVIVNVATPTTASGVPTMHNVGIVQMVWGNVTASSNTTGNSYSNTLLVSTITPQFSDSKIVAILMAPMTASAASNNSYSRIVRGNSAVDISGDCLMGYVNPTIYGFGGTCFGAESSPGAGSAVYYRMQIKSGTAGQSVGTCDQTNPCQQTLMLLEVNQK